ncbi:MAG TPA: preprotein translocase subunit YajC [Vicinamibacteria bacterium]
MADPRFVLSLALAGSPQSEGGNPFASLILMGLIFGIFYFVLIMPMRNKQRKLEQLVQELKSGDKVIINPGIFGTIEGVDDDAFQVRISDKTRIKVLKTAVAGLQGPPPETEKK